MMLDANYFGAMMAHMGDADGFVAGVSQHYPETIRPALQIIMVHGEMMVDTAVVPEITAQDCPFSTLKGPANILIFPYLEAGNVAYKLMMRIGGAEALGPILMGFSKPVHVLQRGATVEDIINMAAIAVVGAQKKAL